MTTLYWLTAAASLVGVVLNVRRQRACFWVFMGTSAVWTTADLLHGLPQQAAVQAAYFGLAVWGVHRWRRAGAPLAPTS